MIKKKDCYDLHIHTNISDGDLSPLQILQLAKKEGLKGISFTEHDTIAAYTEKIFEEAKKMKIELIVGVEISSVHEKQNVHVLGYNFDLADSSFHKFLQKVRIKRKKRNERILEKLRKKGMDITKQELKSSFSPFATLGRLHIAKLMQQKGYVASIKQAFDQYLKDNGCCYVRGEKYSTLQVIEMIKKNKGQAILAHPHLLRSSHLLRSLLKLPFDGLEVFYGRKKAHENKKYLHLAKEKNWKITGGSDFHGEYKPYTKLGSSWIDSSMLKNLRFS